MVKIVILLVVGLIATELYGVPSIATGIANPVAAPIVGGQNAAVGQFKHQVSIWIGAIHNCGGSIISPIHIVTAAHCIPSDKGLWKHLSVVTGTIKWKQGQKHKIKCIHVHPGFTGDLPNDGGKHDIAVITLKKSITFSDVQAPIPLTSKDYSSNKGTPVVVSGWGRLGKDPSNTLKWIRVKISACRNRESNYFICTYLRCGKCFCQGDSGGPLIANGELIGVVSNNIPCAVDVPDVYTNVYTHINFIHKSQEQC